MQKEELTSKYWLNFLAESGRALDLTYYFCDYMGSTEEIASDLLSLILTGMKTATTSCLLGYQAANEKIPKTGDLSIVTDWNGTPSCVIETMNVIILPFNEMTFEICKKEGEDSCLQSWQTTHFDLFTNEGKELGYAFTWNSPVVFEEFRVVYQ